MSRISQTNQLAHVSGRLILDVCRIYAILNNSKDTWATIHIHVAHAPAFMLGDQIKVYNISHDMQIKSQHIRKNPRIHLIAYLAIHLRLLTRISLIVRKF